MSGRVATCTDIDASSPSQGSNECRTDHLCDHGMVRVALGTDDDSLGHGWRS